MKGLDASCWSTDEGCGRPWPVVLAAGVSGGVSVTLFYCWNEGLYAGGFALDIRENFFTERVVRQSKQAAQGSGGI